MQTTTQRTCSVRRVFSIVIPAALLAALATAQPAPETQGQTGGSSNAAPGGGAPADLRTNLELYGNDRDRVAPRYPPQILPLPSEVRIAREASGALPSEIRARADAIGPLSPNGQLDYIPLDARLQRILHLPPSIPTAGPPWERRATPSPMRRPQQEMYPRAANAQSLPPGFDTRLGAGPINAQLPRGTYLPPEATPESTESFPLRRTHRPTTDPSATQPTTRPTTQPY